jgi:chorismate dehydratase
VAELIDGVPARCAELLSQAAVDAALVPVIEYQRLDDISLVPGVCVGSKREVRSVVLVSKGLALEKIRSVALDESSRTSAALVKIVFREFLETEPRWTISAPNPAQMLEDNDAALIIGDPAMTFPRENLVVWDMATLWRKYTKLGFVFAMWMVRDDAAQTARVLDFPGARDEGLSLRDDIIDYYSAMLGLARDSLKEYLEENISFQLDEEMRSGLDLYFSLAHKHGLLPTVKPLKTLEP